MELRPVNFPVEDGHLLTQREILRGEGCSETITLRMCQMREETRAIKVKQIIEKRMSRTN